MANKIKSVAFLLLLLIPSIGQAGLISISSDFSEGRDGWTLSADSTSTTPGWSSAGYISGTDRAVSGYWYFEAPEKFLGDLSGAYGQLFSYDFFHSGAGPIGVAGFNMDIYSGSNFITIDSYNPPKGIWTNYSFTLDESNPWTLNNVLATKSDIIEILSSVTRIRIRGEFIEGTDTGRLDNVLLNKMSIPAPPTISLMGLGVLFATYRFKENKKSRKQHLKCT
ncbi:hypothetical protein J2X32_002570 [Rheinheimera pacifica]|uniref:laminin B domain-containing protein n=1 Tax=Rheinheimera pacifica TaxID=173990 RepID=UPI00285C94AA|nr:laminin B domain-containing protein [Rheinheimera pacifica]MDR6983928.1 hypothetical protein [Rheinheimera pacifica]